MHVWVANQYINPMKHYLLLETCKCSTALFFLCCLLQGATLLRQLVLVCGTIQACPVLHLQERCYVPITQYNRGRQRHVVHHIQCSAPIVRATFQVPMSTSQQHVPLRRRRPLFQLWECHTIGQTQELYQRVPPVLEEHIHQAGVLELKTLSVPHVLCVPQGPIKQEGVQGPLTQPVLHALHVLMVSISLEGVQVLKTLPVPHVLCVPRGPIDRGVALGVPIQSVQRVQHVLVVHIRLEGVPELKTLPVPPAQRVLPGPIDQGGALGALIQSVQRVQHVL